MNRLLNRKPAIEAPSQAKPKRILVIGSSKHSGAKCVPWDVSDFPNVADFDAVIVNTSSLATQLIEVSQSNDEVAWKRLQVNITKIREGLLKLLASQGEIIAVAAPEVRINFAGGRFTERQMTNYFWLPLPLEIVSESGETLDIEDVVFSRYMKEVSSWNFFIQPSEYPTALEWIAQYYGGKFAVSLTHNIIARNRYGRVLAARFYFRLHRLVQGQSTWAMIDPPPMVPQKEPEQISGPLILLPLPTEISDRDAVNIILQDFFGQTQKTLAPEWVEEVVVPGFNKLVGDKALRRKEVERLNLEIHQVEQQIDHLNAYKQLLYETGTPLEHICRQTLEAIGAKVSLAEVAQEEFIVEFEGKRAIAEVKGNTKSISLTDLRQLGHYLEEYEITHSARIKGILLGNAWRLVPLDERRQTDFPSNVVDYALPRNIALVNTVELYKAYCAMLEGKVAGKEILQRLFASAGIASLVNM